MTSEPCPNRSAPAGPAAYILAFIGAIWILLNALGSAYVVTHADTPAVRQFLERVNQADAPPLLGNVN
jgi:hypothetical protein